MVNSAPYFRSPSHFLSPSSTHVIRTTADSNNSMTLAYSSLSRPSSFKLTYLQLVELCRLLDLEEDLGSISGDDLDV